MLRHTLGGLRPLLCRGVLEYGLGPRDTLAVAALTEEHPLRERYSQNDPLHPVLKHGPRSLTYVRVLGVHLPARNESKGNLVAEVGSFVHYRPTMILRMKGLSVSIYVGTRKMVNYA